MGRSDVIYLALVHFSLSWPSARYFSAVAGTNMSWLLVRGWEEIVLR
jgi:hypothetical protein